MGQYYNILTYNDKTYTVYDRHTIEQEGAEPKYTLAKLMEHSWIMNPMMMSFSNIIYQNPTKVAWVGDYCDDVEHGDITNPNLTEEKIIDLHAIAWRGDREGDYMNLLIKPFATENMLLVNWDKKLYVDMTAYIIANMRDGWCIHPLSLLTALGNGLGGGDYHGADLDYVGSWAFDTISFEDRSRKDELDNCLGFETDMYTFVEEYQ